MEPAPCSGNRCFLCSCPTQSGNWSLDWRRLLALSDEGAPVYDHDNAAALAALGVPAFACTPDAFPELMAAAIERRDLRQWAGEHDLVSERPRSG